MTAFENWLVLSLATLLLPLPSIALIAGWVPGFLHPRPGPLKTLGTAGLCAYAALQADTVPRLSQASHDIVAFCAHTAIALIAVSVALAIRYDLKTTPPTSGGVAH